MHVKTNLIPHLWHIPQDRAHFKVEKYFAKADIKLNGGRPWDIQVRNEDLFKRIQRQGSLGFGEAYIEGWWECPKVDELFRRIYCGGLERKFFTWHEAFDVVHCLLFNEQKLSRAFQIGRHHYDIGNDLFDCMLDKRLVYSCGYWRNASTLDEAQEAKLDLICRKLQLEPGMKVLDIGCGWGSAAKFLAERYKAEVTGVTVSEEQIKYAKDECKGLSVDIRYQDYRTLKGRFDRIISIGMIEHVGYKNYHEFMNIVHQNLKDNGLFLLQTVGNNQSVVTGDRWLRHYIFPNGMLPSAKQISSAVEKLFVIEDWHNFGVDYDKTLMHWFQNFHRHWKSLKDHYDDSFYRMWKYYLLSCAGMFRARAVQLWQIVLSPNGIAGGYDAPR